MKWRNRLLALLCLAVFAGLGVLYFQHWVVQKPFGIILIIGEGLAPERIALTRVYLGGADARLTLDGMPNVALVMNYSRDFAAADQAAAASALATGVKLSNRSLSVDSNGKAIPTIIELARSRGRATGLVTNGSLTNATCAAFYAHAGNANDIDQLARELAEGGKVDLCLGMSAAEFLPEAKQGQRQDNRDLLLELRQNGFDVIRTRAELESVPVWRRPKLFGVFANGADDRSWNDQPALADMVRRAIELLQYNARGYVLVIDAARMRSAAETNNAEKTLTETAELDRVVAAAQHYAGAKSTIIVCGDAAIGGLHANGFPFRRDSGIALLGLNPSGEPWMTWATGPKGVQSYGAAKIPEKEGSADSSTGTEKEPSEPAAFYAKSALNTVEDVVAFGIGRGTEKLHGTIDNTQIFKAIRDEL
ncbi:MAG TPA: alkaline phosphatase [Chthoniobacterales bacterium]|jgi:alkaline phosphatase|nr:alkaline phosphatase [Chthoniobacterales bacterium]